MRIRFISTKDGQEKRKSNSVQDPTCLSVSEVTETDKLSAGF